MSFKNTRPHSNTIGSGTLKENLRIDKNINPPTHQAIRLFKERQQFSDNVKPLVIEFGIGSGTDALQYLKQGWRVHGIDAFPQIISQLREAFSEYPLFSAELATLQNFNITEKADIVSCISAFTWNPKSDFPLIWSKVIGSLKDGGLFSFDLYGTQHQWFNQDEVFFNKTEVFYLIEQSDLKIHWQQYYDEQTQLVAGGTARFEYWEFVCEKMPKNANSNEPSAKSKATDQSQEPRQSKKTTSTFSDQIVWGSAELLTDCSKSFVLAASLNLVPHLLTVLPKKHHWMNAKSAELFELALQASFLYYLTESPVPAIIIGGLFCANEVACRLNNQFVNVRDTVSIATDTISTAYAQENLSASTLWNTAKTGASLLGGYAGSLFGRYLNHQIDSSIGHIEAKSAKL